jgi:16S rRNA (adenine1518-N6/adenine1519-N6)-dimethyltransferase
MNTMASKPKLGQNFLHDAQAVQRIVAALGDCSTQTVVEIGPGRGAVTHALAARTRHIVAVELDPELAAQLRERIPPERLTVVNQDVLDFSFVAAAEKAGQCVVVIGNLPYYITSPILLKLAANHAVIDRAVLMMQREVADRVAALPGSRDYGLLSATVQMYGSVLKLFTLPPGAFVPPPKVHSTVIRWEFEPRFTQLHVSEANFFTFLRQAFAQKRKTLVNNLRAAGISPASIAGSFDRVGVDLQARAESLQLETFAALWNELQNAAQRK